MAVNDNTLAHLNEFWWIYNTHQKVYCCSDTLADLCGISDCTFSMDYFISILHPRHRAGVEEGIKKYSTINIFDETYLLLTKYGYRWVNSNAKKSVVNEKGEFEIHGTILFLSDEQAMLLNQEQSNQHLNELIDRYSIISASLMDLMSEKDTSVAIRKALDNLLEAFNGDRAYVFEYDADEKVQSCVYEVVSDNVTAENIMLQNIKTSATKWWTQKIIKDRSSIVCHNIEDLKDFAEYEYDLLKKQNIKSILAMPLMSRDGIRGYVGVDMVKDYYRWSNVDIQWFQSFSNILGLCLDLKRSEQQANIERERYSELYKNMPIGFIRIKLLYNEKGRIIDYIVLNINAAGCVLFDVKQENILNIKASENNIHDLRRQLDFFESIVSSSDTKCNMSYMIGDKYFDNTIYSVDQNEVVILVKDITESTIASRALHKSEATLQNIYNNIPVGIEMYDKNGVLISVNKKEKEIFGFNNDEDVLGINLFDNPNVPKSFLDDLKNNKPSWCDFFYGFNKLNGYYDSENQGEKHIVLRGSILYDANHNVENYILIVLEDTDYLQTSHELQEFKMLFNSIAEFAEIGMCKWSYYDNTINGTDQWYENLGLKKVRITDISAAYINAHPDDSLRIQNGLADMISGKISNYKDELRISNGNGGWRWLGCNYKTSDYRPENDVIELISINIDITELKNTEAKLIDAKHKAEESDRMKSSFIANMSHEIRTPLNSIVGFADLLTDESLEANEKVQYVAIIKQNNEILLQLISDILDISKIDSGMIELVMGSVEVTAVCKDVITSLSPNSKVQLLLDTSPESHIITTDKMRLIQVLKNLVSNALKFTEQGSVRLGYKLEGSNVVFWVKDTGVGIAKDKHADIFNKFMKVNNFIQGTGLGLPICKSIIEKLGGDIWLESEPEVGSCFWFSIPNCVDVES